MIDYDSFSRCHLTDIFFRFSRGRKRVKTSINAAVTASLYKHLLEPQHNVLLNISHSSCTCNGDHVGLLIKAGSIQNERTMTQTTIRNF